MILIFSIPELQIFPNGETANETFEKLEKEKENYLKKLLSSINIIL